MLKILPGIELDVDRGPDWLMVKVHSASRESQACAQLADLLWSLMEQHLTHRIVLELQEVKSLNKQWIEQLLELHDRICHHGGVMRVCGLSPQSQRLLLQRQLTASDPIIPYEDRENAILGHTPRPPK